MDNRCSNPDCNFAWETYIDRYCRVCGRVNEHFNEKEFEVQTERSFEDVYDAECRQGHPTIREAALEDEKAEMYYMLHPLCPLCAKNMLDP